MMQLPVPQSLGRVADAVAAQGSACRLQWCAPVAALHLPRFVQLCADSRLVVKGRQAG